MGEIPKELYDTLRVMERAREGNDEVLELKRQLVAANERTEREARTWRCFHCGFETAGYAEATTHFGERDDPEEFTPTCKWWQRMDEGERAKQFQDLMGELNASREEEAKQRERNDGLEYRLNSVEASIQSFKPFRECSTIEQVFHVYDSMEGRALAAEERAASAERERDEARSESSRAWGLNTSLHAQVAMLHGNYTALEQQLAERDAQLRACAEALEELRFLQCFCEKAWNEAEDCWQDKPCHRCKALAALPAGLRP